MLVDLLLTRDENREMRIPADSCGQCSRKIKYSIGGYAESTQMRVSFIATSMSKVHLPIQEHRCCIDSVSDVGRAR